ncbi:DUF6479 family protein [Actinacidiphila soli]|uniref:DUF6479 family protein n=1 Tax=Actinacidiphila soli TaxID=2487275 RepID=UPI000FCA683F|nr:DUF6479 family protein [Actinacidiphila soli]
MYAPPAGPQPRSGAWHTREEYDTGTAAGHGPGHQSDGPPPVRRETGLREPDEVPHDSRRLRPHEIRDYGSRPAGSGDAERIRTENKADGA